jgi:hypothetical protein
MCLHERGRTQYTQKPNSTAEMTQLAENPTGLVNLSGRRKPISDVDTEQPKHTVK